MTQEEDGSLSFDTECLGDDFLSELLDALKSHIMNRFMLYLAKNGGFK